MKKIVDRKGANENRTTPRDFLERERQSNAFCCCWLLIEWRKEKRISWVYAAIYLFVRRLAPLDDFL